LRLFSFGGYGLALVVFGAYDSYPKTSHYQKSLPKILNGFDKGKGRAGPSERKRGGRDKNDEDSLNEI